MSADKPDITLNYKPGDPDGPWFMSLGASDYPRGKGKYKKIKAPKGEDAVYIFKIKTPDIKFHPTNPVDIRPIDPDKPYKLSQFDAGITDTGDLKIENENIDDDLTEYYYQLNFVDAPPLDPVIQNGCCKVSRAGSDSGTGSIQLMSGTGVIAVLAVATILALLFHLISRWRKS